MVPAFLPGPFHPLAVNDPPTPARSARTWQSCRWVQPGHRRRASLSAAGSSTPAAWSLVAVAARQRWTRQRRLAAGPWPAGQRWRHRRFGRRRQLRAAPLLPGAQPVRCRRRMRGERVEGGRGVGAGEGRAAGLQTELIEQVAAALLRITRAGSHLAGRIVAAEESAEGRNGLDGLGRLPKCAASWLSALLRRKLGLKSRLMQREECQSRRRCPIMRAASSAAVQQAQRASRTHACCDTLFLPLSHLCPRYTSEYLRSP